ncbi:unnamed protein product [Ceutorhynchus assimilis]|uniref:CUB domain-containing protein n=1 Tax=Ceutorhynchus assimilis TaxID=467358 RepID=A0A9P0DKU9_9CUCU|nr:unnamed protein product [Ceutorhynchus assimilis]
MFKILVLVYHFIIFLHFSVAFLKDYKSIDICNLHNARKLYVEYGTSGGLLANYKNQVQDKSRFLEQNVSQKKCSIELITCPSCVIHISFQYLNISRTCGKSSTFSQCGCDYILLHEPPFESASGEQFCGRYMQNNFSELSYHSRTRLTSLDFVYTHDYGHAFTLQFSAKRNQLTFNGYPTNTHLNNDSQIITSPFFPNPYPPDLSAEYVIQCHSRESCRIRLIFTDFLMADSSILEFFDYNGQRMYVISGNIFRPPVIVSSGPSLIMRFYANGASSMGFKAIYSFSTGNVDDIALKPNIDCGGQVNNLGGGITMMDMVTDGTKYYDCVWIVKMATNFLHRKTHLYVKVVNFTDFAGTTELILRQGVTSSEPTVEVLKFPISQFRSSKEKEHIVPIEEGFYISLRGLFKPESKVSIVYAAFNYKDCFSGLDFLCRNLRCISALLNCDGFDHCGDTSDESSECSEDPTAHRDFSKIPNFLFPKIEPYADLTTATFVFLLCTFGLIGIILAMAVLLFRVNMRARNERRIQDHIETIHAILEEGLSDIDEESIIPDEPPDYEAPPEYSEVLKYRCANPPKYRSESPDAEPMSTSFCTSSSSSSLKSISSGKSTNESAYGIDFSCQIDLPESPPPAYEEMGISPEITIPINLNTEMDNVASSSRTTLEEHVSIKIETSSDEDMDEKISCSSEKDFKGSDISSKDNIKKPQSTIYLKGSSLTVKSVSDENLATYFSESEMMYMKSDDTDFRIGNKLTKRSFSANDLGNYM